jgi:tetratricopeptide (TPR) repeat protein
LAEPPADANAEADFRRYLAQYPGGQTRLREVDAALDDVRAILSTALTLARITGELLPRLAAYHHLRERLFQDGPGTGWLRARVAAMAQRLLTLPYQRVTVLACLDHLPFLSEALAGRAELAAPPAITVSEAARERSLLDFAFLGEVADPVSLLAQLREVGSSEARYHQANLLLAHGHAAEALELLEAASRGDFSRPYFLPGYLLARLGQLYDLTGQRDKAIRAYRAVRALAWAPAEALVAAQEGLQLPFSGAGSAR